jgi:hypothetical protein
MTVNIRILAAVFALPLLAAPAPAGTDIPLAPFHAIGLHGGGHVVLRFGATQKVTLVKGDLKTARIEVADGALNLSPCRDTCFGRNDLEVEIASPNIDVVAIHGGGKIEAQGDFPKQAAIAVAVHGGGEIDIRALAVETVSAAVHGGGSILTTPMRALAAAVNGGGEIAYWGKPIVASSVHGGGAITKKGE